MSRPAPASTPTPPEDAPRSWAHDLAAGAPGIALRHIARARDGLTGWDSVHRWATAMTREPVSGHPDTCGLYRGAPAVAYALHTAHQPAYAPAVDQLDEHITALALRRLHHAHGRIDREQFPALREFDLMSGLTGIGVYLMHRQHGSEVLRDVLSYLVRLTTPLTVGGELVPGWWTIHSPQDRPSDHWPGGHANLGLAHGIAGPLALLATSMRRGITVTGQPEAIEYVCAWLDRWRIGTGPYVWWPETISLPEWRSLATRQTGPGRPSWCYGTPGLARAQQLAGLALGDLHRQRYAEQALAGCTGDETQLTRLVDASLCHGWAGLLQTTWRASLDAGPGSDLAARLPSLRARLEQHVQTNPPPSDGGMLEGAAGVELARHTMAANTAPSPAWDACLLLDG